MFRKIGQRFVSYDVSAEGGTGVGGGEGAAHPVAPWSSAEGVWKVGEGETAQPWFTTIQEPEARAHIEAKGYKNPAELALANYSLTKLQRGDPSVVGLPGEAATPEDWNAFYAKLGRPETPDKYEFKFGEGVKADDGMVQFARTAFHEAGLTPRQAQLVADKWNAYVAEQSQQGQQQSTQQNDQEIAALETKWGGNLEKNKAAGQRAMQALGLSPELVTRVENQIGTAAIVELLAAIGSKAGEGSFVNNGNGQGDPNDPANMTKEQAQARVAALQADPAFQLKYTDKKHPEHESAVRMMVGLFAKV